MIYVLTRLVKGIAPITNEVIEANLFKYKLQILLSLYHC